MFEVTGDNIAALNDTDLRALIALLAEAEMRQRNLPASAVAWGGNQTAKDGGLDVHVALPSGTTIDGFVPKAETGFQVKTPDMRRNEILKEMKPNGVIRPVLQDLANASGAYIIVSSTASTSKSALDNRKMAMRDAVSGMPNADKLTLDFFDRSRVATWVRGHAGMIAWVREKIGRAYPHWRPFGAWTVLPPGADPTYLLDDTARIKTGDKDEGDGSTAAAGIDKIRDSLRTPGHVVRLVGLSGVGKTRLAEALFDAKVGTNSLDRALAIYTNAADGPEPSPRGLASDLIAARSSAILVIDNCPRDTHRQLSEIVRTPGSTVSVITVEYDIREDQPEGTEVFSLETSSLPLIEKLVRNRFPNISQVNAQTIAKFSGGNARIALTLAGTLKKNETVAGLAEAELFERLFEQRHGHNPGLLAIAQACSLVYSFDGEKLSGDGAELPVLGGLVGKSASDVFAAVADLKARDLLQMRGPWRAVLPHAIANRLAANGLQRIPPAIIKMALVDGGSERLRQSFSRRLGYLHGSKEARAIVEAWLAPGGLLGDLSNLNEVQRAMLTNVAPVMPDHVLTCVENALASSGHDLTALEPFIGLLRSIAYDISTFDRAAAAIAKFARRSSGSNNSADPTNVFESLFTIVLSGTRAPAMQRLRLIERLLHSSDSGERRIGIKALGAMFKTGQFTSIYGFDFGARSRDYGYHPATEQDVRDWFEAALTTAETFALDGPCAEEVRNQIGLEFRGLWAHSGRRDDVDRIARAIGAKQFWREGWIGARNTQRWEGRRLLEDSRKQLDALELFLRPKDLVSRVSGAVIDSAGGSIDLDEIDEADNEDYAGAFARANKKAEMLGGDLAHTLKDLETLLPKLLSSGGRVANLGKGLALAAKEPRQIWLMMTTALASNEKPNPALLFGFLGGLRERDPVLTGALLDDALENSTLAQQFPVLQVAAGLDEPGLVRLHRALEIGKAPIWQFHNLAMGGNCDAVPGPALKRLVLAIVDKPDGMSVALDILSMRLHSDGSEKRRPVREMTETGRELLQRYVFERKAGRADHEDYELGVTVSASLKGEEGAPIAQHLIRGLLTATGKYEVAGHDFNDLVKGLFEVQPVATLDALFEGGKKAKSNSIRLMQDFLVFGKSPIEDVPDQLIINWCDRDPAVRYPFSAAITVLFRRPDDKSPHVWTPIARRMLAEAPDAAALFKEMVSRLHPTSWSGSLATKLESRLALLNQIDAGQNASLADAIAEARQFFEKRIVDERKRETAEDRAQGGRFE
jgi:hypothetical protein